MAGKFFTIVACNGMQLVSQWHKRIYSLRYSALASFALSFLIQTYPAARSLIVSNAPLWFLLITVSVSISPNHSFWSTIAGLSLMSIRLRIMPRLSFCTPFFQYRRPLFLRCLYSVPLSHLSFQTN